jgi:hypothetical protein
MSRGGVDCLLVNGTRLLIAADAIIGGYAVHSVVFGGQLVRNGWSVTHCASGMRIWTVSQYADAVRVAQWLEEKSGLPATREAMMVLQLQISASATGLQQREALWKQLAAIAPRLHVAGESLLVRGP